MCSYVLGIFLTINCNLKLWPKIYFTLLVSLYPLIILTNYWQLFSFFLLSSGKESACPCRRGKRHGFNPWVKKILWSRKWKPIPVFLPGKFHGQRSMKGYSPWGHKELDITEHTLRDEGSISLLIMLQPHWSIFIYWMHQVSFP